MIRTRTSFWSEDRGLSLLLLFLCCVIFVAVPLRELGLAGGLVLGIFFSLILVSGVLAVSGGRTAAAIVAVLVAMSLTVRWAKLATTVPGLEAWDSLLSMIACAVLAVVVTAHVFRDGPITSARIQGAVAVYLLLGMIWAFAYELLELLRPGAFAFTAAQRPEAVTEFIYFSFVVLTTVGFGDITPVDAVSRSLVSLEALVGQLFPAILLARLVSMEIIHSGERRAGKSAGSKPPDADPDGRPT